LAGVGALLGVGLIFGGPIIFDRMPLSSFEATLPLPLVDHVARSASAGRSEAVGQSRS